MTDDEGSLRAHLDAYYAECRKKDEEEQRQLNERLRTTSPDEWAWLQEQNRQQKELDKLHKERAERNRIEAVRQAEIRAEESAQLKERVERLLAGKGVRLNLDGGEDNWCCCGSYVSIEIDGELLVDTECFDLDMIPK